MQWEFLTSPDFAQAVTETGVCLLAFGVLERHSDHLPLGTDFLNAHQLCCLAAQKEAAVVFPPFYFGQIYEARCFPGALTIAPRLLLELVQSVMDEIGRNGFKKIILVNGHGGNRYLLAFLAQCSLWDEKPYSVYLYIGDQNPERQQARQDLLESDLHAHACECETSTTLASFPDAVKMDQVPPQPTTPLGRLQHLPNNFSGISWYAEFPEHYAGDARTATVEKGQKLLDLETEALAEFIHAVKVDQTVPTLESEFFRRERKLREG